MHPEILLGVAIVVAEAALVLTADRTLRRQIVRRMKDRWSGWLLTEKITDVVFNQHGHAVAQTTKTSQTLITPKTWWKCVLPWPGKRKWAETVLTKVALLGATLEYQAVSAWDWDEAWVIEIDHENIIASSNRIATALAYLEFRGVPER